jgi:hypothetical protein
MLFAIYYDFTKKAFIYGFTISYAFNLFMEPFRVKTIIK